MKKNVSLFLLTFLLVAILSCQKDIVEEVDIMDAKSELSEVEKNFLTQKI